MRGRIDSLFYYAPASLPGSRYISVESLGIHELMARGHISHGGPDWTSYILMHFYTPTAVRVDGEDQEAEGWTMLWEPHSHHYYGNSRARWDHSWANLAGAAVAEMVREERIPLNVPICTGFAQRFEHYLKLLYNELHGRSHQDVVMIHCIVRMWLHELGMVSRREERAGVPDAVTRARKHIESHFQERLTLADLMDVASLSASQLSLLFRRHYGVPPVEYLLSFRIRRAQLLLVYDNLTVSEVADRAGFDDPLYFSRVFRQRVGMSPTVYRRRGAGSERT